MSNFSFLGLLKTFEELHGPSALEDPGAVSAFLDANTPTEYADEAKAVVLAITWSLLAKLKEKDSGEAAKAATQMAMDLAQVERLQPAVALYAVRVLVALAGLGPEPTLEKRLQTVAAPSSGGLSGLGQAPARSEGLASISQFLLRYRMIALLVSVIATMVGANLAREKPAPTPPVASVPAPATAPSPTRPPSAGTGTSPTPPTAPAAAPAAPAASPAAPAAPPQPPQRAEGSKGLPVLVPISSKQEPPLTVERAGEGYAVRFGLQSNDGVLAAVFGFALSSENDGLGTLSLVGGDGKQATSKGALERARVGDRDFFFFTHEWASNTLNVPHLCVAMPISGTGDRLSVSGPFFVLRSTKAPCDKPMAKGRIP